MIYLDNSATTNAKPLSVKFAILKSILNKNMANPGRSGHNASVKLAEKIYSARKSVAKFFNVNNPLKVIFTSGCTESLNLAILGTVKENGTVLTTLNEHNSILRPLYKLERDGKIKIKLLPLNENGIITADMVSEYIDDKTYMLAVNHTSNVTGATCDIEKIGKVCKKHNILFLVDAAQSAGHQNIDFEKCNIDLLAIAGHKGLYGLSGTGALIVSNKVNLKPIKFGGTGTNSENVENPTTIPEGFETGTANFNGIIALQAGIKFIEKNKNKINLKIKYLTKYLLDELSLINNVIIYTKNNCYNGVIAFNIKEYHSSDIANYLNEKRIAVRSGLHCAPFIHKYLGTIETGAVRVSIGRTTKKWHLQKLISAIKLLNVN